jgi:hypothetical protein
MLYRHFLLLILTLFCFHLARLDAETVRNSSIIGVILDDKNKPVLAEVAAYRLDVQSGNLVPTPECFTRVDTEGGFQCNRLPPGTYAVVVHPLEKPLPSPKVPSEQGVTTPPSMFVLYPENTDPEPSDLLHLKEGETQRADIWISLDSLSIFHIESAAGATNSQLRVLLQGEDFIIPVLSSHETVNGIPPGTYTLIQSWSVNDKDYKAVGSITANQLSPNEISLDEIKSYDISGSVRYTDEPPSRSLEVILTPNTKTTTSRNVAHVERDGAFAFSDVVSGTYDVSFEAGKELYISEIFAGNRRVQGTTIYVNDGISQLPLTLVASHTSATISGSVELERCESKPGILVHSLDSHINLIVPVDAHGSFTVSGLVPGRYVLYGWDDIDSVPYESSHFLARYASKAISFDIERTSHLTGLHVECNKVNLNL